MLLPTNPKLPCLHLYPVNYEDRYQHKQESFGFVSELGKATPPPPTAVDNQGIARLHELTSH